MGSGVLEEGKANSMSVPVPSTRCAAPVARWRPGGSVKRAAHAAHHAARGRHVETSQTGKARTCGVIFLLDAGLQLDAVAVFLLHGAGRGGRTVSLRGLRLRGGGLLGSELVAAANVMRHHRLRQASPAAQTCIVPTPRR